MNFKVAEFQQGIRDSRSLFTRAVLKGGPIEPREIVDAYINANRAMFDVKKNLKGDIDAARLLNISEIELDNSLDRVSAAEINNINDNIFTPYQISDSVASAIQENALKIGMSDPLQGALFAIDSLQNKMSNINFNLPEFPVFENPLMPIMQDTPLTPTSLNLPEINAETVAAQVQGGGAGGQFSNLTNKQKFDLLFPNG